ncbi:MAG: hypothetical protein CVU38_16655 [Chloroflexi bacterium HGW-Chloroflexi-1]|nr:MAG: hypothetical protein CVU38_16655 [Chloroflexi bacterium HGW-Chloroflexi-1]
MNLEQVQELVREGKYFYYTHALTEAKKDGVEPEDIIAVILTGEIIEEYPERKRLLIYGRMANNLPLHVVCDYSAESLVIIPTVYIPDRRLWVRFRIRKPLRGEGRK